MSKQETSLSTPGACYLRADLQPEGKRSLREIAIEGLGFSPWPQDQWVMCDPEGQPLDVVPLHLIAGRDVAARALAEWMECARSDPPYYSGFCSPGITLWDEDQENGERDWSLGTHTYTSSLRGPGLGGYATLNDPAEVLRVACVSFDPLGVYALQMEARLRKIRGRHTDILAARSGVEVLALYEIRGGTRPPTDDERARIEWAFESLERARIDLSLQ